MSQEDPYRDDKSNLRYLTANFTNLNTLEDEKFDVVLFYGSLHHFARHDRIMEKVQQLLNPKGLIVVHEPTRDRYDEGNVALSHLVRALLSITGSFYKKSTPPSTKDINCELESLINELKYQDEKGEWVQSPSDNEAGFSGMYGALSNFFTELHFEDRYAFSHEVIGGIRLDDAKTIQLARDLKNIDAFLCKTKVIKATEFFYVGKTMAGCHPRS